MDMTAIGWNAIKKRRFVSMQFRKFALSLMFLCCLMVSVSCSSSSGSGEAATDAEENPVITGDTTGDTGTDTTEVTRPAGWTEETHGKKADPNYAVVFAEGVVQRLEITITAEDWQAMKDDMTSLYGEFGVRSQSDLPGGIGGITPPDMTDPGDAVPPDGIPGGVGVIPPEAANPADTVNPGNLPPQNDGGGNAGGGPVTLVEQNPVWKPCTLVFDGKTWNHAGIRFKGNSSLAATWGSGSYKLPFRFDFDQFEDDYPEIKNQRFYGFQKLSLSSNYSDNSLIREKVAGDIFRDAGVPAPRNAFYRLFIDHGEGLKYFGLYTMVEIPDGPMLAAQFLDDGGNLYKPEGEGATFSIYDESAFDKETHADEADFSDVLALYNAVQADRSSPETWRANLESVFDVDGFLRWLAVNTVIQNWDTYGQMSHNYYLYHDPGDHLIHWIPWDNNEALSSKARQPLSLDLSDSEVGQNWPLIRYLMDDEQYRATYVDHVRATIANVFYPVRMQAIYAAVHELIRPYVVGADGEVAGYTLLSNTAAFDEELAYLNSHAEARYLDALTFVEENKP